MESLRDILLGIAGDPSQKNPEWMVDKDGTMVHRDTNYTIAGSRLSENWLQHLSEKTWVNFNTFVPAYIRACYYAGVKKVNITYLED